MVIGKGLAVRQGMGRDGQNSKTSKILFPLSPANTCWFYLMDGADYGEINLENPICWRKPSLTIVYFNMD